MVWEHSSISEMNLLLTPTFKYINQRVNLVLILVFAVAFYTI